MRLNHTIAPRRLKPFRAFTSAPSRQTKRKSIGQEIERPHQAAGCIIPPFDALRATQAGDRWTGA